MWTSLRQLFGIRPLPTATSPVPQAGGPGSLPAPGPASNLLQLDLDARFSARLLDADLLHPAAIEQAERAVLARLEALTGAALDTGLVPRLPAALPRLLSLARREDTSSRELAEHLSRDPALLGEVIRLANSPRYRGNRDISSLEGAVLLLGQTGLQQLVSRVLMGPVFNRQQGHFSRSASTYLWGQAERCAHGCAFLRLGQTDAFEAYLAGMIANVGMIAALRVLDQDYRSPVAPGSPGFHAALTEVTARLSARIAGLWDFPAEVIEALEQRARLAPPPAEGSLAQALITADQLGKLQLLGAPPDAPAPVLTASEERCWQELQRAFGG
jgi:HD-like signal output (HDOD) protein